MTKAKVYVETTVASYLAAAPSRDIVVAGHQETTRTWWSRCDRFELFVSQAVVEVTPHILWRRRGRATHDGRTASLRKRSELAVRATDGNAHRRRQKSAWGDEVGGPTLPPTHRRRCGLPASGAGFWSEAVRRSWASPHPATFWGHLSLDRQNARYARSSRLAKRAPRRRETAQLFSDGPLTSSRIARKPGPHSDADPRRMDSVDEVTPADPILLPGGHQCTRAGTPFWLRVRDSWQ
jgi:hypothetical protein